MSKRAGSSGGANPYQRTHRSDALHGLESQVQELQHKMRDYVPSGQVEEMMAVLRQLDADVRQLREALLNEGERQERTLEEIKRLMSVPLPAPPSPDTTLMVQCLDRVAELVRLQQETSATMSELLIKSSKRARTESVLQPK